MKKKLILVLVAAVLALGSSLYAEDSKGKASDEEQTRLYTAEDYDGADLELFNFLKETEWKPKAKGFLEHTSIINYASRTSQRWTFKSNGEVWVKASSVGGVTAFYIKDGVITVDSLRLTYDAANDQLVDAVSGRKFNRVGEKPAAKVDSTDATTENKE